MATGLTRIQTSAGNHVMMVMVTPGTAEAFWPLRPEQVLQTLTLRVTLIPRFKQRDFLISHLFISCRGDMLQDKRLNELCQYA